MPATGTPGRTQQIADGGFGHNGSSQDLFQDVRPVQGGAFHGQRAIGIGTNMYTPRHLAMDALHSLTIRMVRLTIAHQFARGGREGQAVINSVFTQMLL